MQCYTELLPPSGVTHALSIPFLSPTVNNLVVVKTSLLQIFTLVNIAPELDGWTAEDKSSRIESSRDTKLHLIAEYDLSGTVTDVNRVKILDSKTGGDAILLSFRNAKLSLIEWDPDRHGISTISIHYYEKEDVTRSPWVPDLSTCGSHLTVDPSSRCAILNFGLRNLAILPFHQAGDDLVMDDYDPNLDGELTEHEAKDGMQSEKKEERKDWTYQTPYAASFVLPLTALDPALLHPISLAFLHEYREPTFGVLYSQVETSSSLLYERKDAVFYSVFTLDLEQRASTTLLSVARLPSDLFKIVALPPPVGGALLLGPNELIHVDQAGKTNAVGVNEFAREVSSFSMADQSDLALRLEGCVVEHLGNGNGDVIMLLSSGEMVLVSFKLDGRSVSGLSVHPISTNAGGKIMHAAASCSAAVGSGKIFFGSEDADSLLVEWSDISSSAKKARVQDADRQPEFSDEDEDDNDTYEDDLYSAAQKVPLDHRPSVDNSIVGSYNFRVLDTLSNIGPLRDIALGKASAQATDRDLTVSADLELVASQGSDRSGGVVLLKREIDPNAIFSFEIDNVESVWSISVSEAKSKTTNFSSSSAQRGADSYVILAKSKSTDKEESVVYAVKDTTLEPFRAPEFNPNEDCTIDVATLAGGTRVVQVLKGEVRIYDISKSHGSIFR
jgi:cleavage and polyadenylation specificity factor subunit 1